MILIDECVTSRLKGNLKDYGLKSKIIAVSQSEFRGKSDEWLQGYCDGLALVFDEPTVLITKDVQFFGLYTSIKKSPYVGEQGIARYGRTDVYKMFVHRKSWHSIWRQLRDWGYD